MPELPEVETVKRTLERSILDRAVRQVALHRPDVVRGLHCQRDLLVDQPVVQFRRLGKQLALIGQSGQTICIHLGMSGRLVYRQAPRPTRPIPPHSHVVWTMEDGSRLEFNDPRRFGGIWCFESEAALTARRWSLLGEDALTITPRHLHQRLQRTTRSIKAALLDQAVVAGLGNIYVDELLFASRVHPLMRADHLTIALVQSLVRRMRSLLARAIEAGGSTVRDYVNGHGQFGQYQQRHRVYGRADQPCRRCQRVLHTMTVAGRTTTWCVDCQPQVVSTE